MGELWGGFPNFVIAIRVKRATKSSKAGEITPVKRLFATHLEAALLSQEGRSLTPLKPYGTPNVSTFTVPPNLTAFRRVRI